MEDIWDSPRWKEYKDSEGLQFTRRSGNLVFSLNVDWFNPSGNKIAGKHCGSDTWSIRTQARPDKSRTPANCIRLDQSLEGLFNSPNNHLAPSTDGSFESD
ncbi:hypothetical protein PCANC_23977 [Puccinia coronata f. sp. avenae]|uniref:Uncharacterized protein n=1 Tax=Puccinia coronata f. sp. avenae TaxID=200324 RepID=A0A2N5TV46_9BASI|nr:hypothetical protein PCANC_23977 [Puccinia coronata f. sp. avenae]